MARMIDADLLKQKLDEREAEDIELYGCAIPEGFCSEDAKEVVDKMPTVDAVEVVHGKWKPSKDFYGFSVCTSCHKCYIVDEWIDGDKWNYCPNCGAKMDLEDDNGTND